MRGVFFVFWFWELVGAGSVGVGRCSAVRCGFRASAVFGSVSVRAGAVSVWCGAVSVWGGAVFGPVSVRASAVFILNGMIFSFLDERRVFKGVV